MWFQPDISVWSKSLDSSQSRDREVSASLQSLNMNLSDGAEILYQNVIKKFKIFRMAWLSWPCFCPRLVSVMSRSCLGLVLVLFQSCLGLVSFLSRFCLSLASVLSSCVGLVSVLSRSCLGLVSVLSRSCLGLVSVLSWSCLSLVLVLSQSCLDCVWKWHFTVKTSMPTKK